MTISSYRPKQAGEYKCIAIFEFSGFEICRKVCVQCGKIALFCAPIWPYLHVTRSDKAPSQATLKF